LPIQGTQVWEEAGYIGGLDSIPSITKFINVTTYGAIPDDGVDDYPQISNAIDNRDIQGNTIIYFPIGTYTISERLLLPSNVIIKGANAETEYKSSLEFDLNFENKQCIYILGKNNVGIEDIFIHRTDFSIPGPIPTPTSHTASSNIHFKNSENCWVSGVHIYNTPRWHIQIHDSSSHISVIGNYFEDGFSHQGGQSYGVAFWGDQANSCLIENNIFKHLRHAMLVQTGVYNNVFGYNYAREKHGMYNILDISTAMGDIALHGHHSGYNSGSSYNLYEGNIVDLIRVDDVWEENGPYNTFFRNNALEGFVIDPIEWTTQTEQNIIGNIYTINDPIYDLIMITQCFYNFNNYDCYYYSLYDKDPFSELSNTEASFYYDSKPDFLQSWPYNPQDDNLAKMRWETGDLLTVNSGWNKYYITDTNYNFLECYYYSYDDPTDTDGPNNELLFFLHNCNTNSPCVTFSLEKSDGTLLLDNQSTSIHASNFNHSLKPFSTYYKREIVQNDYTGPLTIKIYEDGVLTKESIVEYSPSNKPPIPKLFSSATEPKGIYPVNQTNTYCSQLYYNHPYTLKLNAPYQGDFNTWYKIMIEDDGENTYPLNNTSYAQFNDDGTVDLHIPPMDEIIGSGLTDGNVRLKINDVDGWYNHHVLCTSDAFNGLITTISYPGIIWYCIKQYTPSTGCPSIYVNGKYCNNILPLGEDQDSDQFDYIILDKESINPGKTDFQIKEDQNNKNYLDMVQLVGVGHSKEVEIGINNANGYIFPYTAKSLLKYSGKDSIITLTADDSLLINLNDFDIPSVDMIYLKMTSCIILNKYHDDTGSSEKGEVVEGRITSKDTTNIDTLDVIGLHEEYFTSFTELHSDEVSFSGDVIFLKPSRDIQISEISIILPTGGKDELEIIAVPIEDAISLQEGRSVLNEIQNDDDCYFEFGKDDGVRCMFGKPSFISEEIDYVVVANGRYKHIEEETVNNLETSQYPNPFSTSTTISFTLPKNVENAQLKIYNLKGQLVKTYKLDNEESSITWDGKNKNGFSVANGIYFYKLTCNNKSVVKKIIFLQ